MFLGLLLTTYTYVIHVIKISSFNRSKLNNNSVCIVELQTEIYTKVRPYSGLNKYGSGRPSDLNRNPV